MNIISTDTQPQAQPSAPQWRSTPMTPGATLLYFDPALAMEIGETKAIVLQKVWDWMECNRINNKQTHFVGGQWYTYNSAKEWRDNHFWHLSVATVKKVFQDLEKQGYLQRIQPLKHKGDCRPWVTIPAAARARIDAMSAANTPEQEYPMGDYKSPLGDKKYPMGGVKQSPTKENLQIKNLQTKTTNSKDKQQQLSQPEPTPETDVVVADPLPHPAGENESGEHCIDGEGHDTSAVKAHTPHEQRNDQQQPFPKVPVKGFPPLVADLIGFGMAPYQARRLPDQYVEDDVRYVMAYALNSSSVNNPPGFLVRELEKGAAGVLGLRDLQKDLQPSPASIDAERQAAIRRYNERMEAEDREREAQQAPPVPEFA